MFVVLVKKLHFGGPSEGLSIESDWVLALYLAVERTAGLPIREVYDLVIAKKPALSVLGLIRG